MQSHYITLPYGDQNPETVRIHYRTAGDPNHPVVLCMHALTATAYDFDYLAERLASRYYIVAPDMPGRGDSGHLVDKTAYGNEHYLKLTMDLLAELNITQVHWIGASMGGLLGMMACAFYPNLVQSLMLNDVGSVLAKEGLAAIAHYTAIPYPKRDNAAFEAKMREDVTPFAIQSDAHWQHFFQNRVTKDEEGYYHMKRDPEIVTPLRQLVEESPEPQDMSMEPFWDQVRCPVLIFHGAESLLFRKETAESMAKRSDIPVELHSFPGVGHMPNLMDKEQIDLMEDWLNKVEKSAILSG